MGVEQGQPFERVVRNLDPQNRLLRAWALRGGVSAQVTALEVARPDGQRVRLVVRRRDPQSSERRPRAAADEFRLLRLLRGAGIPAPEAYLLDESREILPMPYLVLEYVEGAPELAPADLSTFLDQLAAQLARIHDVPRAGRELSFLPAARDYWSARLRERPSRLDDSLQEGKIRQVLGAAWPLAVRNGPVLLHGDFWPGNVLWRDGRIVAVIDWEDAQVGDPLADLANTRLELLWAFGTQAMHAFTRRYGALRAVDWTHLPYWDLCAALRPAGRLASWGLDPATANKMRARHRLFVRQAGARLGASGGWLSR